MKILSATGSTAARCAALLTLLPLAAPAQDGAFKAKNRSTFNGTLVARDPFWPIGWKKEMKTSEAEGSDVEVTGDQFVVTSILLSPPALAVINGKEYGEGQFIPVPGSTQKAQVAAIQDGMVSILYRGKTVIGTLRRNEHLSTPKASDAAPGSAASPGQAAAAQP